MNEPEKELVRALQQTEGRLRAILEYSHDGIVSVDADGQIVVFNHGASVIFGYEAEEVLGASLDILVPEASRDVHRQRVREFCASSQHAKRMCERSEVSGRRKGGERFPAEITLSKAEVDGELLLTAFVRDVSRQRQLEMQFVAAQRLHAVGIFALGVAHDFNAILHVVQCNAYLAGRVSDDAARDLCIDEINTAVAKGKAMTQQLMGFARHSPGRRRKLALAEVLTQMQSFIGHLVGSAVRFDTRFEVTTGVVSVDRSRIEQLIMNLVLNARDAMPHGGTLRVVSMRRRLSASRRTSHGLIPAGDYAVVEVSDSGAGMAPEVAQRLFEPFYTTKEPGRGTGLGLTVVRDVAAEHEAHLDVRSELGRGSCFSIWFPIVAGEPEPLVREVAAPVSFRGNATILLVDDDPALRSALGRVLESAGYRVLRARSGRDALDRCLSGDVPDLMLLDVVMPTMSGPEVARSLREAGVAVPLLFMSSYGAAGLAKWGAEVDPGILLHKPFSMAELFSAVERNLRTW